MILLFFLISSPLFLSWSLRTGEAKIISGSVQKNTEWTYFTKFCFENNGGEISFELIFPDTQCEPNRVNGSHCLSLVFYYDEDEVFRKLYEGSAKNLPCEDKIRPPYLGHPSQLIHLDSSVSGSYDYGVAESMCFRMQDNVINCSSYRQINTLRPRWWFIALANCGNPENKIELTSFRLEMTNGDSYQKHFSYDERIIMETVGATLGLFVLLLLVVIYSALTLMAENMLHNTYILYFSVVIIEIIGLFFIFLSYLFYQSGSEILQLKNTGEFFSMFAHFLYLYLIMLLAKGYTVTRGSLRLIEHIIIASLFIFYLLIYCSAYGSYVYQQNNALVTHMYGSGLGIVAPVGKFLMLCVFCLACFTTLTKYPEKRKFYFPFIVFHILWFIAGIIVVIVAVYFLDDWYRAKVITLIKCAFNFITYAYFAYLVIPSKHNQNFPYHVRTNQIVSHDEDKNYPHEEEDVPTELKSGDTFSNIFNVGTHEVDPDVIRAQRAFRQELPEVPGNSNVNNSFANTDIPDAPSQQDSERTYPTVDDQTSESPMV